MDSISIIIDIQKFENKAQLELQTCITPVEWCFLVTWETMAANVGLHKEDLVVLANTLGVCILT